MVEFFLAPITNSTSFDCQKYNQFRLGDVLHIKGFTKQWVGMDPRLDCSVWSAIDLYCVRRPLFLPTFMTLDTESV